MTTPSSHNLETLDAMRRDLSRMVVTQTVALFSMSTMAFLMWKLDWFPWQQAVLDAWKVFASFVVFTLLLVIAGGWSVATAFRTTGWLRLAVDGGPRFIEATFISYFMMMLAISGAIGRSVTPLLASCPGASQAVASLASSELFVGAIGFGIFKLVVIRQASAKKA